MKEIKLDAEDGQQIRKEIRKCRTPNDFPTEILHVNKEKGGWGLKELATSADCQILLKTTYQDTLW